jgi:hypothetical protein
LPDSIIQDWLANELKLDIWTKNERSLKLKFDVSSGVDLDRVETNISALMNLPRVDYVLDNNVVAPTTSYFIANIILSWFLALGISTPDLRDWLKRCKSSSESVDSVFSWLEGMANGITYKEPTSYPLPTFLDVTFKASQNTLNLFGNSPEEAMFTHQVLVGVSTY